MLSEIKMNIKERNFNILRDKISGMTIVKIAEKYSLSHTTISNVLNAQLSKVAEFDFNFTRRTESLQSLLESSEENAKLLAEKCYKLENEKLSYSENIEKLEKKLSRYKSEVSALKLQLSSFESEIAKLMVLKEENIIRKHRSEYENIKTNINKYRT